MHCRQATSKDIPELIELMKQLGYLIESGSLQQNLIYYGTSVLVLEKEGQVVGCLAYHILPLFHVAEKHMRIVSLVVDQRYRRGGCGAHLMKAAETLALSEGCSAIELTSAAHRIQNGAHAFYARLGYRSNAEKIYFRKSLCE